MIKRIALSGPAEYDALTASRGFYGWKAGTIKKIKRGYCKRFRKAVRHETSLIAAQTTAATTPSAPQGQG